LVSVLFNGYDSSGKNLDTFALVVFILYLCFFILGGT
jgi:hypothetical protein